MWKKFNKISANKNIKLQQMENTWYCTKKSTFTVMTAILILIKYIAYQKFERHHKTNSQQKL